jgi:uncharacterized protein (DUF1697 family)
VERNGSAGLRRRKLREYIGLRRIPMARYVALLRGVNVGGTGKLPMADLKRICREAGFERIETYIASGNVVFESAETGDGVKSELEHRLHDYAGKAIQVFIRTAAEMRAVLRANPFPKADPARSYAFFLAGKPPPDASSTVRHKADEQIHVGKREIYVHYPSGMGQSRLVIPAATAGTARNMNTVAKLVEMSLESA